MNILHINYSDTIGDRFNGFYMLDYSDVDFNIQMVVWKRNSNNKNVHLIPPRNPLLKFVIEKIIHLGVKLGLDHLISIGGSFLLSRQEYFRNADIVHLHIIHGDTNISVFTLPKICKKKRVIWTLHDQWAITGGCIHPFECKGGMVGCPTYCPHPRYNSLFKHSFPYFIWKIKKKCYSKSSLNLVVSTNWMNDKVNKSPILKHKPLNVIPFGVDIAKFNRKDRNICREKLGIPLDDFVITFRDSGLKHDIFKGLKYIKEALLNMNVVKSISLLIIEDGHGFDDLSSKYNIIKTGWIKSEELIEVMSCADVFLMPSIQESFGLMAIEAMACKLPVIVAEGTALPDIIGHEQGGLVVPAKDSNAILNAISFLIEHPIYTQDLGKNARRRVEELFTIDKCIESHKKLYSEVYNNISYE